MTQEQRLGTAPEAGIKAPCVASSPSNITLSGEQTVDGIAVVAGDRVLVRSQTDSTENGIYDVSTSAWSRSTDWNHNKDVISGVLVIDASKLITYAAIFTGDFSIDVTSPIFYVLTLIHGFHNIEESILTDGQTVVVMTNDTTLSDFYIAGLLADNGRIFETTDYTVVHATKTITLAQSYPAGTRLIMIYPSPGPVVPAFRGALVIGSSGIQSVSDTTNVDILFDTEIYDTDAIHSTVSNTDRLVVPTGVTKVRLIALTKWSFNPGNYGYRQHRINKNGSSYPGYAQTNVEAQHDAISLAQVQTPVLSVNGGDYFQLQLYQDTGVTQTILYGSTGTWFAMEIIE